jgi:hypothetical protein
MEKIQDNSGDIKKPKKFFFGIMLLAISSIIGWAGLFICNALAFKFGKKMVILSAIIYGLSWIPFGAGFWLAGSEGVMYAKSFFKKFFRRGN